VELDDVAEGRQAVEYDHGKMECVSMMMMLATKRVGEKMRTHHHPVQAHVGLDTASIKKCWQKSKGPPPPDAGACQAIHRFTDAAGLLS
jgi:hypothetical protein